MEFFASVWALFRSVCVMPDPILCSSVLHLQEISQGYLEENGPGICFLWGQHVIPSDGGTLCTAQIASWWLTEEAVSLPLLYEPCSLIKSRDSTGFPVVSQKGFRMMF